MTRFTEPGLYVTVQSIIYEELLKVAEKIVKFETKAQALALKKSTEPGEMRALAKLKDKVFRLKGKQEILRTELKLGSMKGSSPAVQEGTKIKGINS